jgi:prepilin-type N-terminal cleavage/methylation domain-containing protein
MRHSDVRFRRDARRGFSLIEIMVAVSLLTVITVGLLAMFYHTQRAFRIGTSQADVLEGGRATLRMVALDLQEMYPSRIDYVVNFQAVTNSTLRIDMPLPDNAVMENLLQDVAFLTRRGNEWSAILYRVHHANGAGVLYRAVVSTNIGGFLTNANATPAIQWVAISNLLSITAQAANPSITNAVNIPFDRIADGVVHFRVHAYDKKGIRLVETNSLYARNWNENYHFTNWVPEYVEFELGILDPKAMKQFQAREYDSAKAQDYLTNQGYRTHLFHQRVEIRSRREEFDLFARP